MLLLVSLMITLTINCALFVIAYTKQSDKLTDFAYSLSFVIVALTTLVLSSRQSLLSFVATTMVLVWALRLGCFLVYRIRKSGKDTRFDSIRGDLFKFLQFWIAQGFVAWFLLLPLIFIANNNTDFDTLTWVGVGIWFVGLSVETIADLQKYHFNQRSKNKGKWIASGLWKYSRHPNYLGEILVWIGMYLTLFSSLDTLERWIGILSPLAIFVTLRFVSGVPLLEASADKRWGSDPKYRFYKNHTGLILPRFRR